MDIRMNVPIFLIHGKKKKQILFTDKAKYLKYYKKNKRMTYILKYIDITKFN